MAEMLNPLVSAIDPGRFRNYCTIEVNEGGTIDEHGQQSENWVPIQNGGAWLEIEPLNGRELWRAQAIFPDATHVVRGYYLGGVTTDMRVRFDTRLLQIMEPPRNVGERGIYMEFFARERR